ncbi:Polyadenylate-binding protein (RRM superfamily) [Handroanthus impetiginosus]|uniref:Polyadenylate-binding protein n=1 Tax=Handroanthus impetiginosus TaxID=429701 RepID=A0A2G9GUN7_9LAMI|nr:Polyadenylate-binding protein (RRM superfamily) [Handroanthus impetiginosus]
MEVAPAEPAAALYVGDLQQDVTDGMLFDAFKEFKSIASVRVCRDSVTGRSLCYGYANFFSREDAIHAIEVKNHSKLNGKAIRVMWSHRDPDARRSGIGNVFVKNLSESTDSMKLQEIFGKFGTILSCKVVTSHDGKSEGYGFVQFESEDSANAAIENLHGSIVEGKQMYVGKFVKKSDRAFPCHEAKYTNLYMKNIDTDVSEEVLTVKFSEYGKILSLVILKDENGASRGFGFVNFENPDDAKHAEEALNGSQLGSKVLYVARAQKKSERAEMLRCQFEEKRRAQILKYKASNVYVKNIADGITDEDLKEHFSQFGTITSAKLMRDDKGVSKGFGFVCFSTPDEANQAVNAMHGSFLRRKPLYVAIAQRKEERQAQLKLRYAPHMGGLAGPSSAIPGGYSPLYYPAPGVVAPIPAAHGLMYPPMGISPGWRANGFANIYRPAVQPSPVPSVSNSPRYHRQSRGRTNGHALPQGGGSASALHLHQSTRSLVSSKDSNIQQHSGLVKYSKSGLLNKGSPAVQPASVATSLGVERTDILSSLLAAASPERQKQILGERLYPLVGQHKPDLAAKITGMLLEMDNSELLLLLDSPESVAAKVEDAVEVLKLSKAQVSGQEPLRSNHLSTRVAVN